MRRTGIVAGIVLTLAFLCLVFLIPLRTGTERTGPVPDRAKAQATPTSSLAQVSLQGVEIRPSAVVVTLTVQSSGPGLLLFDTPLLAGEPPTPDSLEQARFALLDLVSGGQAQIALEFPRPAQGPPWLLVFNPQHTPENTVAPRVEIEINPDDR